MPKYRVKTTEIHDAVYWVYADSAAAAIDKVRPSEREYPWDEVSFMGSLGRETVPGSEFVVELLA